MSIVRLSVRISTQMQARKRCEISGWYDVGNLHALYTSPPSANLITRIIPTGSAQ